MPNYVVYVYASGNSEVDVEAPDRETAIDSALDIAAEVCEADWSWSEVREIPE